MWKDAISPMAGAVVSLLIVILSVLVLVDPNTKFNPSGNTFATAQLVIGIGAFCVSVVLSVLWWRRKREFEVDYRGPESPPPPNCFYTLLGFLVSISVVALSSLILESESEKTTTETEGGDPSGIYVFASVTVAVAVVALLFFATNLILWGVRKYRA